MRPFINQNYIKTLLVFVLLLASKTSYSQVFFETFPIPSMITTAGSCRAPFNKTIDGIELTTDRQYVWFSLRGQCIAGANEDLNDGISGNITFTFAQALFVKSIELMGNNGTWTITPSSGTPITHNGTGLIPLNFDNITSFTISSSSTDFYKFQNLKVGSAPSFDTFSIASSISNTSFTLETDIDKAGTIYYVVVVDGATAPTSTEVKAGTGSGGAAAITSGNAVVSTGDFTNDFSVTGLTAGTAYDVYVVAEDDDGTSLQSTPTKIAITTNTSPAFTSSAVTSVNDNATYSYEIATSDSNSDEVTLTATTKPSWLDFTAANQDAVVTTFAGSGTSTTLDGTGIAAQFITPVSIDTDGSGNLYVVTNDEGTYRIRKITPAGVVTTLASASGSANGPLVSAQFSGVQGIAVDNAGVLYIADTYNHRIRKIATDGTVSTLAGSSQGYTDDTGTSAQFNTPWALDLDGSGNVYVADRNNNRIRKITAAGVVTTLAGSTQGDVLGIGTAAQFYWPEGIAVDASGNIFVSDRNHKIKKVTPAGVVTLLAGSTQGFGDGAGSVAKFDFPGGMDADAAGNVYLADSFNQRIRKITSDGTVTTIAGNGSETFANGTGVVAKFARPFDLIIGTQGDLFIADGINYRIRKIDITHPATLSGDATGQTGTHDIILTANDGNGGTTTQEFTVTVNDATAPVFENSTPSSASIAATSFTLNTDINDAGKIYYVAIADGAAAPTSAEVKAGTGSGGSGQVTSGNAAVITGGFTNAFSVTGLTGNTAYDVYVVAEDDESVSNIQSSPTKVDITTLNSPPTFTSTAVTSVKAGSAYSYEITGSDPDGDDLTFTAPTLPSWLSLSPSGVSTLAGSTLGFADGTSTAAQFNAPFDVAVDGSGNFYVADRFNQRIRKINAAGEVTTLAGSGTQGYADGTGTAAQFSNPASVAVDDSGNVYVAENGNSRIRKIDPSGVVTTLAGSGVFGFSDGTGTAAQFASPYGIAVDDSGNVFVSDFSNHRIRKISPSGVVTTLAGSGVAGFADGTGTAAQFNNPVGIDVDDSGNVYVADYNNHRIRKISPSGVVTTLAGSGVAASVDGTGTAAQFSNPTGMALDNSGNLYVTGHQAHSIRKISPTGVVTTLAGTGIAGAVDGELAEAQFNQPTGIAIDDSGYVYVAEQSNHRIRKIAPKSVLKGMPTTAEIGDHSVVLKANDGNGGTVQQSFTITVSEAVPPVLTSAASADFAENGTGTAYTVTATDANTVTYSLGSSNDEALFDIDAASGVVTFKATPDYESPTDGDANNTYVINVIASDVAENKSNQDVTITVSDVDEINPVLTSATTADFAENGTGTAYTVAATDANALTYSLGSGNDEGLFDIVSGSGIVTFKTTPDFEVPADGDANNTYVVNVVASDGINSVNQDVTITVTDVDDTDPVITSATTADFAENGTGTTYTVAATDANSLTYSLGSGNDEALFDIDAASGIVTFKATPDFETPADGDANNTYVVNVVASDGINSVNQDVTITVTDVDDTNPVLTSATTADFAENGTGTAYTVAATDANSLTYSLGSGNDEALFDIVAASGIVTFKATPDFETPTDSDANNTYVVNVVASDGINSVNQDVTITVTDVDDTNPVITSTTTADFAENGTGTAYTVAATDANSLTYSLGSGNDEALFDIVSGTGVVSFKTAPDFEVPTDSDANNTYVINVIANDGINSANQDVTISVTDVDDTNPVLTSSTTVDFAENSTGTAYTVAATDANNLTYSLGSGNDEGLFDIVSGTGVVSFKASPDFEVPTDSDANNTYVINVIANDGINSVNQDVTITVTDIDDTNPVLTSATTADFAENGTGTAYTVAATDANSLTYSLGSGNDEGLFDIVSGTGVVSFKTAPDFENPIDGDANNTYVINVIANDGINSSNQDVTISVTNVDDTNPVLTSATTADFAENGTGTAYTVAATDANSLTYSLGSGNDEGLFDIVSGTGVVSFKTAPDFENPIDSDANNTYVINVIANDGINSSNQDVTISVTDVDDTNPVLTSATTADFAENGTGTAYTVAATHANSLTYSLGSGNDEGLFDIGSGTGVVSFKTVPDFENPTDGDSNNTYVINVIANDGINSANQDVTITVTDVDEINPVLTSATTADFAENGTSTAYTVAATDANSLTYSLGSGNDEGLFDIVSGTGVVSFKTAPDFEVPTDSDANNTYVINVMANDGINSANQDVTISVTDVDDTAPVFTSATTADFAENGTGTAYTVAATDANSLTYSLGSGNDEGLFDIGSGTGVVSFKTAPDFEVPTDSDANNTYVVNVVASNGINSANQDVTISVTDIDDTNPVLTSATTAGFAENGTGTAYTVAATHANSLTYSLGSDNDEGLFDIVSGTGVVSFKTAPDFEVPTDSDANNTYVINVIANDGINSANQDVTISVTDVDEINPVLTSATTADFAENGTGTAYTVAATDANSLTYSLGSGNDEGLFDIDSGTGVVSFKTAPDFEVPTDSDANNTYVINVIANDGINSANQDVTISIIDVNEVPSFDFIPNPDQIVLNNDGAQSISAFALNITDGDDQVTQVVTFNLSNDNNDLFSIQPSIDATTGNLTYTLDGNNIGIAAITVNLSDDGGTANGGNDTSDSQTFLIEVGTITAIEGQPFNLESISIYPNPTDRALNLDLSDLDWRDVSATITNLAGTKYFVRKSIKSNFLTINVEDYAPGVYIVLLNSEDAMISKKVIIRR